MKALLVKEDGLIYAAEVPEKPDRAIHPSNRSENESPDYYQDIIRYEHELTSAKESAVLVSDQEKAKDLLFKPGMKVIIDKDFSNGGEVTLLEWAKLYATFKHDGEPWWTMKHKLTAKPGIYPIPDLQWEVKESWGPYHENTFPEKVAILKESTPSHFNGCSPTACGCKSLADCPNNQPQITVMGQGYKFKKFPERLKESTPSTEQESQEELWDEAQLRVKDNLGTYSNDLVCDLARWAIEEMKKHYIITRKP